MRLKGNQVAEFVFAVIEDQTDQKLRTILKDNVAKTWETLVETGTGVAYGVLKDGKPAGFLLGVYFSEIMSGQRQAFEFLWVVSPDKKSGGVAKTLLKEFEDDARKAGCQAVLIG